MYGSLLHLLVLTIFHIQIMYGDQAESIRRKNTRKNHVTTTTTTTESPSENSGDYPNYEDLDWYIPPFTKVTYNYSNPDNTTGSVDLYYRLPSGLPIINTSIDVDFGSYINIIVSMVNISNEIINMSYFDANDYVNQRCDKLYGGFIPFEFENENQLFSSALLYKCTRVNLKHAPIQSLPIYQILSEIFFSYNSYALPLVAFIGVFFSIKNIRLFLTRKALHNEFVVLLPILSLCYIFYIIIRLN
jgi:hypothetical protein